MKLSYNKIKEVLVAKRDNPKFSLRQIAGATFISHSMVREVLRKFELNEKDKVREK